jgi:hypothetical protein
VLIGLLLSIVSWPSFGEAMETCARLGVLTPGAGWPARGLFSNDDYGFSVRIPGGFIAWSGADKDAPFHGFGFRLDRTGQSCINLDMGWRVDIDEPPSLPAGLTPVSMSGATAGVADTRGKIHDGRYLNRTVYFTSKRGEAFVDGRVTLVVPASEEKQARPVFDAFVRSLTFPSN